MYDERPSNTGSSAPPHDAPSTRASAPFELASFLSAALRALIDFCFLRRKATRNAPVTQQEDPEPPVVEPQPMDGDLLTKIMPFPIQDG